MRYFKECKIATFILVKMKIEETRIEIRWQIIGYLEANPSY